MKTLGEKKNAERREDRVSSILLLRLLPWDIVADKRKRDGNILIQGGRMEIRAS
jgi:hypothetical protein